ncbi:MAG: ATP synthase F1 subunit delta [Pseudomonadota bacterium]|nr:ATP synthase F1 subunit delta [Pseudomonadota bacterium]
MKRLAGRYVRALFDVAESAQALDMVEKDLPALGRALSASEEFRHFLANPLLTRVQQEQVMETMLDNMKAGKITRQFIAMLARHRRLSALSEIITLFAEVAVAARGEMQVQLITAVPPDKRDITTIGARLGKIYGKKVNLAVSQNADLLGGIVIKIGSTQLDGSLAGKLARLNQTLRAA